MLTPEHVGSIAKTNIVFQMAGFLAGKQLLPNKYSLSMKKNKILDWRKYLLKRVKDCIDNLNSGKIDSTKENFVQPLSIVDILNEPVII